MRTLVRTLVTGAKLLALIIVGAVIPAIAAGEGTKTIVIERPWARASIMQSRPGVAYLTIVNNGKRADRLIEASAPAAGHIMIHESQMVDGVMSMRHRENVPIEPGQSVALEPGGLHLMLMDLKQPLRKGEEFDVTLRFEHGGLVKVRVPILAVGSAGPK